ncbi:MAG: PD-(D/E)XK nuclease family protein [Bacteroidaceae bacterium]|nr:PD-(D/E)XK nuclease family protein [Bacteroidaceae bacterium]
MTPFLQLVANDIYNKFNGDLTDIAIVFPNKRAGLFFNKYLLQNSNRPIWSPKYLTISELFEQCSNTIKADPILLVCKLYNIYCKHTHSNESIDRFYHWGELMIKDFDDIDKNLADADTLFTNLNDLQALGNGSDVLTDEQREAISRFFINFKTEEKSEIKKRFLNIWQVLGDIYHDFKEALRKDNIAYEGQLYRDTIEKIDTLSFPYKKYIFVGFNALNGVECTLFDTLKERGQALFYWDYDNSYINAQYHEAGLFMHRNLKRFPNALSDELFDNLSTKKNIEIISTATESIQARYIPEKIKSLVGGNEIDTAIILCDETMLESVLHTIPNDIKNINVTMGYPISHTPVYSLMRMLIDLQTRGYDEGQLTFTLEHVHNLLTHPYIIHCCPKAKEIDKKILEERCFFPDIDFFKGDELLEQLFTRFTDNSLWIASLGNAIYRIAQIITGKEDREGDIYEQLFREALLKTFTLTQRFITIIESGEAIMQQSTIGNLFMSALSMQSMPFHGEPVVGMQIMGLLETRNLDFKNLVMLSVNEGNLPKSGGDSSFVPYNLRRAFGLTLSEHRDSIYAYNFYRLMQRAENITFLYNSSTESATRGECSRYILQLLADNNHYIENISLQARQQNRIIEPRCIQKDKEIISKLTKRYNFANGNKAQILSPTAINQYIKCPLCFFYKYVLYLKKPQELTSELQATDVGNIFHAAAEDFYNKITENGQQRIEKSSLTPYIEKDALLYKFIDESFGKLFFKREKGFTYDGEQYINREVLHRFLLKLIKSDATHAPFTYIGSEKDINFPIVIKNPNKEEDIELCIGGRIDRIDEKDGTWSIIDYKTGGRIDKIGNITEVFEGKKSGSGYILQTLLYSIAAIENKMCEKASPTLIYIHKKFSEQRKDCVVKIADTPIVNVEMVRQEFMKLLNNLLEEIFDIEKPFKPIDDIKRCEWCDFKNLCGR